MIFKTGGITGVWRPNPQRGPGWRKPPPKKEYPGAQSPAAKQSYTYPIANAASNFAQIPVYATKLEQVLSSS